MGPSWASACRAVLRCATLRSGALRLAGAREVRGRYAGGTVVRKAGGTAEVRGGTPEVRRRYGGGTREVRWVRAREVRRRSSGLGSFFQHRNNVHGTRGVPRRSPPLRYTLIGAGHSKEIGVPIYIPITAPVAMIPLHTAASHSAVPSWPRSTSPPWGRRVNSFIH